MNNKVKPIPRPKMPNEVTISRNPWKKRAKWLIFIIIFTIAAIGVWIGVVANRAINKITDDGQSKSSLLSLLSDFNTGNIKGKSEGRTNILILGMGGKNHPGGMLSDTMILASINYQDQKIGMISVPRDLWVPIAGYGHAKINEAYADGEKNKSTTTSGGALSSRTIENVLGVPVHYYLSLDFEGFKKMVDTVGGVDIYVENAINDPSYPADNMVDYSPFKLSAGLQHMDGSLALKYVRSRKTTSDFDRSRRQMQVMAAVRDKILSTGILANPKKITDLLNILGDHIRTNMQVSDIKSLWEVGKTLDTTNIISKVLDTSNDGLLVASQDSRGYYVYPRKGIDNFSEIQKMVKNIFTPEAEDGTSAKIEVLNGSGKAGIASSVSTYLESYGYNVTKIGNGGETSTTTIFDCSSGKYAQTTEKIAGMLKAKKETKSCQTDIQIIVGQDYLTNR